MERDRQGLGQPVLSSIMPLARPANHRQRPIPGAGGCDRPVLGRRRDRPKAVCPLPRAALHVGMQMLRRADQRRAAVGRA
jgi:hypothetical protein